MANTLLPGQVRTGQLFTRDRGDGTPMLSATLIFDERHGAQVLVPYVRGVPQFEEVRGWFRTMSPPSSMLFADNEGVVALVGVRWWGEAGGNLVTGRLVVDTAIFGQPRRLKQEYRVRTLRSGIDGLEGFTNFHPVRYEYTDPGEPIVVTLDESETVTWRSGGFTYGLRAIAVWSGTRGRQLDVKSVPVLTTSCHRGATPHEHLRAQWAVRDLLLLAQGSKLSWRSHVIEDEQFPVLTLDGAEHGPEPAPTLFSSTVGQHALPEPRPIDLAFPALNLAALGGRGLQRWTDLYADDLFRRAVQPIAEVINGAATFLEPKLMMLASALDYFGYYRFGDQRRRRPMHESIRKCLDDAGLDWPDIGTRAGIANAITCLNNDLKHPDRDRRPDRGELACTVALATLIARAQPFDLLGATTAARDAFLRSRDARLMVETFQGYGLRIQDDGSFVRAS